MDLATEEKLAETGGIQQGILEIISSPCVSMEVDLRTASAPALLGSCPTLWWARRRKAGWGPPAARRQC